MELPRLPFGSSASSSLSVILTIGDLKLGVDVLLCGGCPGGSGSASGRRVLRCVSWFVEWDSFVKASRRSSGSSISLLLALYLAITVVLVLAQLQSERS